MTQSAIPAFDHFSDVEVVHFATGFALPRLRERWALTFNFDYLRRNADAEKGRFGEYQDFDFSAGRKDGVQTYFSYP